MVLASTVGFAQCLQNLQLLENAVIHNHIIEDAGYTSAAWVELLCECLKNILLIDTGAIQKTYSEMHDIIMVILPDHLLAEFRHIAITPNAPSQPESNAMHSR